VSDDQQTVVTLESLVEGARAKAAEHPKAQVRDAWLGLALAAERVQRAIKAQERQVYLPRRPVH
jgi:hypothetical protein